MVVPLSVTLAACGALALLAVAVGVWAYWIGVEDGWKEGGR